MVNIGSGNRFVDLPHQAITWTNVDLLPKVLCGIILMAIS